MSSAIEAMGMSLPYSASAPATHPDKLKECAIVGQYIKTIIEKDIKPRDIVTKKAMENACATIIALGGSTNAVLHFLAIAHAYEIDFTLKDIQRISDKTPFIADLKPSGQQVVYPIENPIKKDGHLQMLFGNLAEEGAVAKITGKEGTHFEGPAVVFDDEFSAIKGIAEGK
ncbi:unnamed protein product, partial [Cyprideis torosa]